MTNLPELQLEKSFKKDTPSPEKIAGCIAKARHFLKDAQNERLHLASRHLLLFSITSIWCAIVLRAEGWIVGDDANEWAIIEGFRYFVGEEVDEIANYMNRCCNICYSIDSFKPLEDYTEQDIDQLEKCIEKLETIILCWLKEKHPDLLPDE